MNFSRLSIRTTLLITISVLNILIAVMAGSAVYRSWHNLTEMQKLSRESAIVHLLYNAEKSLSIERGLSMALVNTPTDIAKPFYLDLLKSRREFEEKLSLALEKVNGRNDPEMVAAINEIMDGRQKLKTMRLKLDKALSVTNTDGDEQLYDLIFQTTTDSVTDIKALIQILSAPLLNMSTIASQQIYFKHFIWEITEYSGKEYAMIGRFIVENQAPTPEMQDLLVSWKSRTEHNWEVSQQFAESSGLAEKMKSHIEEAKTHYMITFDQIKDMFYGTGPNRINPPYPIGIELWLEMSTQVMDSLTALNDMALLEAQNYIEQLAVSARENITFNLTMFFCAMILSFYSWWVILQRVIKPVDKMADSLYRQAYVAGSSVPVKAISVQDEIGKLSLALDVFQENTRKIQQVSNDLEQQRNNLKAVFEAALDAIVVIDEEGLVTEWNSQAEVIFGWPREEVIGKKMSDLIIPSAYHEHHEAGMKRFLLDGTAKILNKRIELEAQNRRGNVFPVELAITAIKVNDRFNFTAFISDITERKNAEEERQVYMRDLENSNRELDDFAYIASHDLKEPLRGLHNFSRFLLEDYEAKLDNEGKNMLQTIAGLTKRMDMLLSSLLHYSRLGRTELSVRKTDLNEMIGNVIAMYAVRIEETGASVKIMQKLPSVVCDHVRIGEVFQNLIGNALKYTDSDNIKIQIGYRTDHPDYPDEPVYFVADNGIGIDKKNFESIFKIFRRLHTQDAYGGGTGSGLTIAKKIINQHHGKIWAESDGKNQGTTFFFTIPPQDASSTQQAA